MPITIQYGSPGASMVGGLAAGTYRSRKDEERERRLALAREREIRARQLEGQQQRLFEAGMQQRQFGQQVGMEGLRGKQEMELQGLRGKQQMGMLEAEWGAEGYRRKFLAETFNQKAVASQASWVDKNIAEAVVKGRQAAGPNAEAIWSGPEGLASKLHRIDTLDRPPEERLRMRLEWLGKFNEQVDVLRTLVPRTKQEQFEADAVYPEQGNKSWVATPTTRNGVTTWKFSGIPPAKQEAEGAKATATQQGKQETIQRNAAKAAQDLYNHLRETIRRELRIKDNYGVIHEPTREQIEARVWEIWPSGVPKPWEAPSAVSGSVPGAVSAPLPGVAGPQPAPAPPQSPSATAPGPSPPPLAAPAGETPQDAKSLVAQAGKMSPDEKYVWNGTQWMPTEQGPNSPLISPQGAAPPPTSDATMDDEWLKEGPMTRERANAIQHTYTVAVAEGQTIPPMLAERAAEAKRWLGENFRP